MITQEQSQCLKSRIAETLDAAVEAAFAGSMNPDDADDCRQYALDCASDLQVFIDTLTEKPT